MVLQARYGGKQYERVNGLDDEWDGGKTSNRGDKACHWVCSP